MLLGCMLKRRHCPRKEKSDGTHLALAASAENRLGTLTGEQPALATG